jgi:hypothetical protein
MQVRRVAGQLLTWKYLVEDVYCLIGENPGAGGFKEYEQSPIYL